jgi:hypothetical protein
MLQIKYFDTQKETKVREGKWTACQRWSHRAQGGACRRDKGTSTQSINDCDEQPAHRIEKLATHQEREIRGRPSLL